MSVKTIVFQMNNTDNSYELTVLADQLGDAVGPSHNDHTLRPKVSLPSDWVRESRRAKAPTDYVSRTSYSQTEAASNDVLLRVPSLAYAVLNDHRYSTFIYETLTQTGVPAAQATEYLEEHLTESLNEVCTQLRVAP